MYEKFVKSLNKSREIVILFFSDALCSISIIFKSLRELTSAIKLAFVKNLKLSSMFKSLSTNQNLHKKN